MAEPVTTDADTPVHRYSAALANEIETRWQDRWEADGTFHTPNPVGPLSDGFATMAGKPARYIADMFPYPSGAGLHVGHPLGYIGTDVYARYLRMTGHNVVHTMGYDAFGLPAEQYALQTNTHPRVTTEANIATMRAQLRRLGLAHDDRRSVSTTDTDFYRWTQWIFLQIFGAWYDRDADRARPIDELVAELDAGVRRPDSGTDDTGKAWSELDASERRRIVNRHRLAYLADVPVNWCPGLGTVLANEEVTADGRSERGNFPVYRRNLKQWMFRITAYADRLIDDLDQLDWTDAIKNQQRNWIGRSTGARVVFPTGAGALEVFTTRPDTLFGATYMVVAPEHPLVGALTTDEWPAGTAEAWTGGEATPKAAVTAYQEAASRRSEIDRQAADKAKTGVFTGSFATNPVNDEQIPVFVADYVLMGYGTGAIMAVPGQDQRDWDFAETYDLPIIRTVQPSDGFDGKAFTGEGPAINSGFLDGLEVGPAKEAIIAWLVEHGHGTATVQYKLRDWLFSRQRYWGEPFPIVFGADGEARALPEDQLPLELPPMEDFTPKTSDDEDSDPEPPLGRVEGWTTVELDLGDGEGVQTYRRELNTMPNWAGSCWYELRYLDPTNSERFVDPENERYWMGPGDRKPHGGVDLYVGGAEHAVLHLLYARFWHKVLFDLGHVSSKEPFHRLFNQGMIQAPVFRDDRGFPVPAADVVHADGTYTYEGARVTREIGKIGKSLKNVVTPDEIFEQYGTDTLRLYEMFTGPLDQSRPWDSTAIVGMFRLLQRIWRVVVDEETGAVRVDDGATPSDETQRVLHQTIAAVRDGMEGLRSNTSIARITELTNHLTGTYPDGGVPRPVAEDLVLLLAPLAPHAAEELWSRLGHDDTVTYASYPEADPAWLVADTVELPVQVNGKVRGRVTVAADADRDALEAAARAAVAAQLEGGTVRKVIVVPGKMVSFVV
ncbi:leucine--tRNA ligase [Iamia sp. SCSIO 61187]|uniref:leucine--tRNA ligase n=1 Tax=Iamia sp. SCSIO 61187 TaxID=2722752 RepID=UPI001C62E147|nr:leucine--tRNA ligase [Iamia sp. SCSIO 61187]QYG93429.1 leucine--tRNA ligase [Iamia sp. SCSIO 61187]